MTSLESKIKEIEKYETQIGKANPKLAIENLIKFCKKHHFEQEGSDIQQISSRYRNLIQQKFLGVVRDENYQVTFNEINQGILLFITNLKEKIYDEFEGKAADTKSINDLAFFYERKEEDLPLEEANLLLKHLAESNKKLKSGSIIKKWIGNQWVMISLGAIALGCSYYIGKKSETSGIKVDTNIADKERWNKDSLQLVLKNDSLRHALNNALAYPPKPPPSNGQKISGSDKEAAGDSTKMVTHGNQPTQKELKKYITFEIKCSDNNKDKEFEKNLEKGLRNMIEINRNKEVILKYTKSGTTVRINIPSERKEYEYTGDFSITELDSIINYIQKQSK